MILGAAPRAHDSPETISGEAPLWHLDRRGDEALVTLAGHWTAENAGSMEIAAAAFMTALAQCPRIGFDLSHVNRLDTAGAWILDRSRHELTKLGCRVSFRTTHDEHRILLDEVDHYDVPHERAVSHRSLFDLLIALGHAVVDLSKGFVASLGFLGAFIAGLAHVVAKPRLFRATSLVNQLDLVALRGVPIIVLISFLVGGIIAQQGIFQLRRFGATSFVVDLVGILTLRELGVLLTAIMVAGRSGSAITAEIGSMKMREEIDAIRVMGLDPMEVLIIPRLLALVIGLPMLAFLSDIAALSGGGLVAWIYEGISPSIFLARLQDAIALNTFLVGLIKSPFMALIIGLIAAIEGFAVQGSAESLGRHVTSSVVKAIFMVIVADGLFAMFFAAVSY